MPYNEETVDRREFDGYLKAKIEEITGIKKEISVINDKIDKLSIDMATSSSNFIHQIEVLKSEIKLILEKQEHIQFKNYLKLVTLAMGTGAFFGLIGGFLYKPASPLPVFLLISP